MEEEQEAERTRYTEFVELEELTKEKGCKEGKESVGGIVGQMKVDTRV